MIQPAPTPAITGAGLRLSVRHLTRFVYHGPVCDSFNEVRLEPLSDALQTCRGFELRLAPEARRRTFTDLHRNRVHYFEITSPHERLDIEALSLVETLPDPRPPLAGPVPLAALDSPDCTELFFDFVVDSPFVPLADPLREEARRAHDGPVNDLWATAVALGEHVHRTFTFTPQATKVTTNVLEALLARQGVCQDYAHVMLGLCRSLGIPARYVSGYFYNPELRPDQPEASHAWVEVLVPGFGWRGYDPTHHRIPDSSYLKLAVGRDYGDIRPVSGTFRGRGTREMLVEVQVRLAG